MGLVGDTSGKPDTLSRLIRIEERTTLLRRSADDTDATERVVVANVDKLVIVVAAANPEPRTGFVDRALVAAYDAGIQPVLCVTKADVKDPADFLTRYEGLDFPVVIFRTTAADASGVDARSADGASARLDAGALAELEQILSGCVSVVLGHSRSRQVHPGQRADRLHPRHRARERGDRPRPAHLLQRPGPAPRRYPLAPG